MVRSGLRETEGAAGDIPEEDMPLLVVHNRKITEHDDSDPYREQQTSQPPPKGFANNKRTNRRRQKDRTAKPCRDEND
jgi:hypothetical protein